MEVGSIAADVHEHEHHGPPKPNQSSRVDAQTLGIYLFIISEVMLFGAFFTAYFFLRVVKGDPWPAPGTDIPVLVAAVNTAVLVSSSFTMHWATMAAKAGNRAAMRAGLFATFFLGLTFLSVQLNEYVHLGWSPQNHAQGTIFYGLTGLHGAHVTVGLILLLFANIRANRGHFSPQEHRGVEVPGIYWHFVDVMWIVVFTSLYIL
jgi:cytochrome c oxidase subunit III